MNPLSDKPNLRKRIYQAFWTIGAALGAVQVGFASVEQGTPDALKAGLAIYAFLGGAIGYTAAANVGNPAQPDDVIVDDLDDDESLLDH